MESQIVNKQRVLEHGEVYTNQREVNAMLDLVKHETERIDSRFLEPACGTGNFLAEVLRRKLKVVERRFSNNPVAYQRAVVVAIGSIYGIDILKDNVENCRKRMYKIVESAYALLFERERFLKNIKYILERNIVYGDALTFKTPDSAQLPIVFPEWSPVNGNKIKRKDYEFYELLSFAGTKEKPLFSDMGDEVFFPEPVREFPPTDYLELANVQD